MGHVKHQSRDAGRRRSEPFVGCTSYMRDYVRPPPQSPQPKAERPARPRTANVIPFQGKSTYEAEYTEKPLPTLLTGRSKAIDVMGKEPLPFQGITDYQNNYIKHNTPQPVIHFEPELSRSCSPASCKR